MTKCKTICKNGKRCTRDAKYGEYCTRHRPIEDEHTNLEEEKAHEEIEEIQSVLENADTDTESMTQSSTSKNMMNIENKGAKEDTDQDVEKENSNDKRITINPVVQIDQGSPESKTIKKTYKKKKRDIYIHPSIITSIQEFVQDFMKSHPKCPMRFFQNIISATWKDYKKEMFAHVELNDYQKFMRDNIKLLEDELNHKDKVKRIGVMWNDMKKKKLTVTIKK